MKSKTTTIILIISILINFTIAAIWFYNSQHSSYDTCLNEKKILSTQIDTLKSQLNQAWTAEKYQFEVMLNSGLDFQKSMPEYIDMSKEKFIEAIRQKVVELKIKLREK